jgi:hypothetical protein
VGGDRGLNSSRKFASRSAKANFQWQQHRAAYQRGGNHLSIDPSTGERRIKSVLFACHELAALSARDSALTTRRRTTFASDNDILRMNRKL